MNEPLQYLSGLGNHHQSEAIKNALVKHRNSPQTVPYGLYAEQLSGSAFTAPRHQNLHSWLYKIFPAVSHSEFTLFNSSQLTAPPTTTQFTPPTQMRWNPLPYPTESRHFIEGLMTLAGNGSIEMQNGAAIHLYAINSSMQDEYFYNADGEFLIVPQEGKLRFKTELGLLDVQPGEMIVIPRGVIFQVLLQSDKARGYVCENFGAPFHLPELGIIGANGLANPRDFLIPVAAFEERQGTFSLITKFQGVLWQARIDHSPLCVVAWHGTYTPYKYDLSLFNTVNSVSFDHPDPSIFTVLTSASGIMGVANVDFVIFPSRWIVADDTFRPPYFHRNIMSEYMGLIYGNYDAKPNGFLPGGGSLHNCMSAHGPDTESYKNAVSKILKPEYYDNTLAFMFESKQVWRLTENALNAEFRQKDYLHCWKGLKSNYKSSSIA